MGKKIFVSYKYGDNSVYPLSEISNTTVRHYVDYLQSILDSEDHINKGEADGEDLSNFQDETIWSKLRNKIYDSSITIVMISKNMREAWKLDKDQWIPWEISYSLKEHSRGDRTSQTNAILAVVIPDEYGSYNYFMEKKICCTNGCTLYYNHSLFGILKANMFNVKSPNMYTCQNSTNIYNGYFSYIHCVRWDDFIQSVNHYLDIVININSNKDDYEIHKTV
jgi:hypothetical protein